MLVGYARTSTIDQAAGFNDQVEQLRWLGVEKDLPGAGVRSRFPAAA
jgi:DNA invertase Pin-like site-specific DNA recombinase